MEARRDDYLGQVRFQVVVRPHRVAYLVPRGDRDAVRRAIQEASTRWGGISEPILPVSERGKIGAPLRQILEAAGVDGLVSVRLTDEQANAAAIDVGLPVVPIQHLPRTWDRATSNPAITAEVGAFDSLTMASADGPLWEAVAAGDLADPEHPPAAGHVDLPTRRAHDGYEIARGSLAASTLIDATAQQFDQNFAAGMWNVAPALLWVTKPNSLVDAVAFWNLRALRLLGDPEPAPMLIVPPEAFEHWLHFDERLAYWLGRPVEVEPDVVIFSRSLRAEELHAIAAKSAFKQLGKRRLSGKVGWPLPPPRTPPYHYLIGIDPRTWLLHDRRYGTSAWPVVQAFRGETLVAFESPVSFNYDHRGGAVIEMRGGPIDELPRHPVAAQMVLPAAQWNGDWLQWATPAVTRFEFTMHLPDAPSVVKRLLDVATTSQELSTKGLLGLSVMSRFDLGILLDPLAYRCIGQLTTPREEALVGRLARAIGTDSLPDETRRLIEGISGRAERISRGAGDFTDLGRRADVADALERLASAGWVERGVYLHCGTGCAQRWFVRFDEVTTPPKCPGCQTIGRYALDGQQLSVRYRLNSLIDRASDQGVLAHLRVIEWLSLRHEIHVLPGVDVRWDEPLTLSEVDLFGIVGREVMAGEVKTTASAFTKPQIIRDMTLTQRLGASTHVMATMDTLPSRIRAIAEAEAVRRGLTLVVVDADNLSQRG